MTVISEHHAIELMTSELRSRNERIKQLERLNATLAAEVDIQRGIVDAVIGHKRDLGFKFPVQVEAAIDAYEAAKREGGE